MKASDLITIFFSILSISLGLGFGIIITKLISTRSKSKLKWACYCLGLIIIISAIIITDIYWLDISKYLILTIVSILTFLSGIGLLILTKLFLDKKYIYKTDELNPVVNSFTQNADKKNIVLLAGDLDFFGNSPNEIDVHPQYTCLKQANFRSIEILCFKPKSNIEKIRFGKILNDLPIILRFYRPSQADLNIRGRMKTLNGIVHLLIYNKVRSKEYEALQLNTADLSGALYNHIWQLVWSLAEVPSISDLEEFKKLYNG